MTAVSNTLRITPSGSVKDVLRSSFQASPVEILASRVKFPVSRITCYSPLVASKIDLARMKPTFSHSLLYREKSFDDWEADRFGLNLEPISPWHFPQATVGDSGRSPGFPARLPCMDISLRYANVMWFKGSYNAEIICTEDEPVESIIRRFRRAVSQAGVMSECQRRRFRETRQDTVKRKQLLVSRNRRRKPTLDASSAWTGNAWKLSKEHLKPVDHSKKKKKSRIYPRQTKQGASDKRTDDVDDDYWGYTVEGDETRASLE